MLAQSLKEIAGTYCHCEVSVNPEGGYFIKRVCRVSEEDMNAFKQKLQTKIASIQALDSNLYPQAMKDQMIAPIQSDLDKCS